jgi:hypothetical protein
VNGYKTSRSLRTSSTVIVILYTGRRD